jgi:hypothetical protein
LPGADLLEFQEICCSIGAVLKFVTAIVTANGRQCRNESRADAPFCTISEADDQRRNNTTPLRLVEDE